MTKIQLPVLVGNEPDLFEYANKIKTQLSKATESWKEVAQIFAAAQDQFGRQSKEMTTLGKETGFGEAKIDKLVQIAKNVRLKENEKIFSTVTTWTVLYDVTLLNDEQFDMLKTELQNGENLTSKLIASIRNPKKNEDKDKTQMQNFASIQMDINAIRSEVADQADYEYLLSTLQELSQRVPYIKIKVNDLLTKDIEKHSKEMYREYERVVRKAFIDERTRYLNRVKRTCDSVYHKKRKKEVYEESNDLLLDKEYSRAFECVESDQFDQAKFLSEAQTKVSARREARFGQRVSEPYSNDDLIYLPQAA